MIKIHDKADYVMTGADTYRTFGARRRQLVVPQVQKSEFPEGVFEYPTAMAGYRGYRPTIEFQPQPVFTDYYERPHETEARLGYKALPGSLKTIIDEIRRIRATAMRSATASESVKKGEYDRLNLRLSKVLKEQSPPDKWGNIARLLEEHKEFEARSKIKMMKKEFSREEGKEEEGEEIIPVSPQMILMDETGLALGSLQVLKGEVSPDEALGDPGPSPKEEEKSVKKGPVPRAIDMGDAPADTIVLKLEHFKRGDQPGKSNIRVSKRFHGNKGSTNLLNLNVNDPEHEKFLRAKGVYDEYVAPLSTEYLLDKLNRNLVYADEKATDDYYALVDYVSQKN